MNNRIITLVLVTLGLAALHGAAADARQHAGSQDVQIYAGEIFGGRLTEPPPGGRSPLLNDDPVFGGRYTYDLTDRWGPAALERL
jgi:hypothetical protein